MITIDYDGAATSIVDYALSLDGLDAGNPAHRATWLGLLGPLPSWAQWDLDRPFRCRKVDGKWRTQGLSTCGLVANGILRHHQVIIRTLYEPYVFGTAISSVVQAAREQDCWQSPIAPPLAPYPGDYVVIGSGLRTHVLTCVGFADGGPGGAADPSEAPRSLVSIDGGQVHPQTGLQMVRRVERPLRWRYTTGARRAGWTLWLGDRRVLGWADVAGWDWGSTSQALEVVRRT